MTTADARFPLAFDADAVRRALQRLPARQRAALVLRFRDGLCERDVAAVLGCRTVTVAVLIRRGMRRMGQQLARDGAVAAQGNDAAAAAALARSLPR